MQNAKIHNAELPRLVGGYRLRREINGLRPEIKQIILFFWLNSLLNWFDITNGQRKIWKISEEVRGKREEGRGKREEGRVPSYS